MFELKGRPLRRSERVELRDARAARQRDALEAKITMAKAVIDERQGRIAELKDRMADQEIRRADLESQMTRLLAVTQKVADRDQQTAATLAAWLLTSALAANLAGLWALINDKTTDHNPLFWALVWFTLGVITSFVAGTVRLAIASKNWTAMMLNLSRAAVTEERTEKRRTVVEGKAVNAGIITLTAMPIGLFLTGSIVMVCARLF